MSVDDEAVRPIDPSGVPHLDMVLGGGIQRGALVMVVGPPGSGKTTLAAQMACAAARAGRRTLIVTAYSEPPVKLIDHMRSFTFFVDDLLGDLLQVQSVQQFLPQGLAATADEIRAEVRRTRTSLLVLDGFRGMRGGDPQAARQFLYEMGTALGLMATTTIITSEAPPRDVSLFPEVTTADVLLGLHDQLEGVRQRRSIEVIKARGMAPLSGLHSLIPTSDGLVVAPRLEARAVAASSPVAGTAELASSERAAFSLPELDMLLGGGLTRDVPTLVLGSPGTGKTLLGLCFALAGLGQGEPTVFLGFQETAAELVLKADAFGLGAEMRRALAPGGGLTLLRQLPVERDPDVIADDVLTALDRSRARRLVVDSLSTIERALGEMGDRRRTANYLGALVEVLRVRGVTTLFLKESTALTTAVLSLEADYVSLVAANVLWLQRVTHRGKLYRVLSVPKMRFSAHDVTLREFTITSPAGLQVLEPFASEPGVLDAIARRQGDSTERTPPPPVPPETAPPQPPAGGQA